MLNKGKESGITLKDIQVWLGHSDYATTANIYAHIDAASKNSSLSVLSDIVDISEIDNPDTEDDKINAISA